MADATGRRPLDIPGATGTRLRARPRSAVVEYRFADGRRIVAKRYARAAEASDASAILTELIAAGFDAPARLRVPRPIACIPGAGVVLMWRAAGDRLPDLGGHAARWAFGMRCAGMWLGRLHSLPATSAGDRRSPHGSQRLARRAERATAARPDCAHLVTALLDELEQRARAESASPAPVPTHGRFHPGHVFVAAGFVTVIDTDRLGMGDPALDIGEFLHRLQVLARRLHLGEAATARSAQRFLAGYREVAGAIPAGIVHGWSYSIVSMLLHQLEAGHSRLSDRIDASLSELAAVPSMAAVLLGSAAAER